MIRWSFPQATDHPRERGEHKSVRHDAGAKLGSSPRARGTLCFEPAALDQVRIIPASAGNTVSRPNGRISRADHPRERGEHWAARWAARNARGSSPRARGTRWGRCPVRMRVRIIPASAGNTVRGVCAAGAGADHPRERGEHEITPVDSCSPTGSSPRARGTLCLESIETPPLFSSADSYRTLRPVLKSQVPSSAASSGAKLTSFSPSNSRGMRRL